MLRIGFLGMQSEFSARPLAALLESGFDVRFVMRPLSREHRAEPVLVREVRPSATDEGRPNGPWRDPFTVAEAAGVPRLLVGDASAQPVLDLVKRERVDALVVAFFNQLLRPALFEPLPLGAVNAHPSLLPRYRGPAPLFWTYRDGECRSGLTVHRIARGEDDGDILSQAAEPVAFGQRGEALLEALAGRAARALPEVLSALAKGGVSATAQDARAATRAPRPGDADLRVDRSLPGRRLFSFVRGVGRWNPLYVEGGLGRVRVIDALGFEEGARVPADWVWFGDVLRIGCADGVVALRTVAGA